MELAIPFGFRTAGTSRGLASVDGRAFVQEFLPRPFLHATLVPQSGETPHPQGSRLSYPEAVDRPIRLEEVATNRLDRAQRSIGTLPIMGRTLPITMEEPDRRSG
jgi:hypothetical protein